MRIADGERGRTLRAQQLSIELFAIFISLFQEGIKFFFFFPFRLPLGRPLAPPRDAFKSGGPLKKISPTNCRAHFLVRSLGGVVLVQCGGAWAPGDDSVRRRPNRPASW